MIIHDKKQALQTILSKRGKDGEMSSSPMAPERPAMDESGEMDGRHEAAQDMIQAFHEKSAQKLVDAYANMHELHMSHLAKASDTEAD